MATLSRAQSKTKTAFLAEVTESIKFKAYEHSVMTPRTLSISWLIDRLSVLSFDLVIDSLAFVLSVSTNLSLLDII